MRGVLAIPAPARTRTAPAVLLVHGNVGQPDYQEAIAADLASQGYVALAFERFSRYPGTTWETVQADGSGPRRFLAQSFIDEEASELRGALDYLAAHPGVAKARLAIVGFCGGAIHAARLASEDPRIRAIVSFYGPPVLPAQYKHPTDPLLDMMTYAPRLRTPIQLHYGTGDYVVRKDQTEQFAAIVSASGTPVETYAYDGARHGFYQRPQPSELTAVELARSRMLRFLGEYLTR